MSLTVALTGNDAAAEALRQADPDVAAVYPITPQTELMHKFASFVANGEVNTELVLVESEHSAMSAAIGASAAGARTITATSANGLALMWEVVYIAASLRLPIVMPEVSRALSGPINIHCDHSDSMGCRDSGWVIIFSENAQEAYDNTIQAFRIAEHSDVLLPVMVTLDGFILSHTMERLDLLDDDVVKKFVGEYVSANPLLDTDHPRTYGPLDLPNYYFEHKRQQLEAMRHVPKVAQDVADEFAEISGRSYGPLEAYKMDDAEYAVVCLGSTAGTAHVAVDNARDLGIKAGLVKPRLYRPFPAKEIIDTLSACKAVAVLDRAACFGVEGGPLLHDVRSFAFEARSAFAVAPYVYGLGGRDINVEQILSVFHDLGRLEAQQSPDVVFIGLRE